MILISGNPDPLTGSGFSRSGEYVSTWQLNDVYREVVVLAQPGTSLQYKQREGMTAYGNAAPLTVKQDPSENDLAGKTYVFRGGRVHTTTDPAIRQLWLDSGFGVTEL